MFSRGMSFASKCPRNMYQYLKEENEVQKDQIILSFINPLKNEVASPWPLATNAYKTRVRDLTEFTQ